MQSFHLSALLPAIALMVVWISFFGLIHRSSKIKLRVLTLLQSSGSEATAHITDVQNYVANQGRYTKGQIALAVSYEFKTKSGNLQQSRLRVQVRRLSRPDMFTGAPDMIVLYREDRPSVNILKNVLPAKLAETQDYRSRVKRIGRVGTVALAALVICGLAINL